MRLYSPYSAKYYHKTSSMFRQTLLLFLIFILNACSTSIENKTKNIGFVSVLDKNIAQVGELVFQEGGNAADAMSAMLMSGAVLLPSRMGLGAGGLCQVLDPAQGHVKTLNFLSTPMSFDYQIGVPALARGVYTLQNKYGNKPWAEVLSDAIKKSEKGIKVSETLAKDILTTGGLSISWKNLKKGDNLKQPKLAETLRTLSISGAGALYQGQLANSIVSQSQQIVLEDLKNFKVSFMDSIDVTTPSGKTFFPNPTILSSEGYTIWRNAQSDKAVRQEQAKIEIQQLENKLLDKQIEGMSLITADTSGLVIACNVSMGTLFGTTQLTEQGFYLGQIVSHKDASSVFSNILETNPDITDATAVVLGVGNYALSDTLNFLSEKVNEKPLSKGAISEEKMLSIFCEKGYPNHAFSCTENENLYFIYSKID